MKPSILLVGVAVLALAAGAANAQSNGNPGNGNNGNGGSNGNAGGGNPNNGNNGNGGSNGNAGGNGNGNGGNPNNGNNGNGGTNGNAGGNGGPSSPDLPIFSVTVTGNGGNNGTASTTAGATFTLKGNVTKDCAYYTGNASTTVDFGTIGIYASDSTGPAAAFDMTAPATVSIDTNLAGCNTSNTVTVSKSNANGLINNAGVGYDSNVFQANLPYTVKGTYTAGAVGSTAAASSGNWIDVGLADQADSNTHGAWKSAMSLDVVIPVPSKSLLAGNYQGDLSVSITAF